jgi:hypothetical protein
VPHASPQLWAAMLVANYRRHAHPASATPSHSRPIATGSPHRRLPTSTFLRSLSAPPRSIPTAPTTTLVRASPQTTILVRASDPVPTLPPCVPENPRHTTSSPGPPSLAARLWRSFDGGVGKERTSKAIASPRAQERIEPVACRQKSSRLSLNPHPTRGSPARSFRPHSKVCRAIRSKRFGVGRELPKSMPERSIAKGQLPPKEQQGSPACEPNRAPGLSARQSRRIYGGVGVAARPTPRPSCPSARALKTNSKCPAETLANRQRQEHPHAPTLSLRLSVSSLPHPSLPSFALSHLRTAALSLFLPLSRNPPHQSCAKFFGFAHHSPEILVSCAA